MVAAQPVVLGQLPQAAGPLTRRQRREGRCVADDCRRLPVRPDQVLPLGQVHSGLAADRRVDLGQEGGGDVHHRDPAVVHRGGEAGDVGHDPAADRHDAVGTTQAPLCPRRAQPFDGRNGLVPLSVADEEHPVLHAGVHRDGHGLLGHDGHPSDPPWNQRRQLRDRSRTDDHRVRPVVGKRHLHDDRCLGHVDCSGSLGSCDDPASPAPTTIDRLVSWSLSRCAVSSGEAVASTTRWATSRYRVSRS